MTTTFGSLSRVPTYDTLPGRRLVLGADAPLKLDCGVDLAPCTVAYQTYGQLNEARTNAVLVCHALTGDQYVAEDHPVTGKKGWWEMMVGPARPIDTDRFFIICANVLGGCMGSSGPREIDPKTGKPYGLSFPVITIGDMVEAQLRVIRHLGIERLFAVIGGSMGAMQVLQWASRHPDKVFAAIPIAVAAHGRMPVTPARAYQWWETPNIHLCSIRDFLRLAETLDVAIVEGLALDVNGRPLPSQVTSRWANLIATQAIFKLRRG